MNRPKFLAALGLTSFIFGLIIAGQVILMVEILHTADGGWRVTNWTCFYGQSSVGFNCAFLNYAELNLLCYVASMVGLVLWQYYRNPPPDK